MKLARMLMMHRREAKTKLVAVNGKLVNITVSSLALPALRGS
jgi:hypothetical protein